MLNVHHTEQVLALGDTASLSSQPFSSSPFALVAVPLLYAFVGATVATVLIIFGLVVRICSEGACSRQCLLPLSPCVRVCARVRVCACVCACV